MLTKPKILPLKSVTLEKLEEMQKKVCVCALYTMYDYSHMMADTCKFPEYQYGASSVIWNPTGQEGSE